VLPLCVLINCTLTLSCTTAHLQLVALSTSSLKTAATPTRAERGSGSSELDADYSAQQQQQLNNMLSPEPTITGGVGTYHYASPEQVRLLLMLLVPHSQKNS
jgi:hypothetical protein